MFGDSIDIPVVQASIDESLSPEKNWEIGKAVSELRWGIEEIYWDLFLNKFLSSEGVLVLSGGLTIHTFRDWSAFSEVLAKPIYKEFDKAVTDAASISDVRPRLFIVKYYASSPSCELAYRTPQGFDRPCDASWIQNGSSSWGAFRPYLCCGRLWWGGRCKGC